MRRSVFPSGMLPIKLPALTVTSVSQVQEIGSFHGLTILHVEARYDSFSQHFSVVLWEKG